MDYTDILMVIRNYRGMKEINYLLSVDDFFKTFFDGEHDERLINALRHRCKQPGQGWSDATLAANDTFLLRFCESRGDLLKFLFGAYNDDIAEVILLNADANSLEEIMEGYLDWYWMLDVRQCSKDILEFIRTDKVLREYAVDKAYYPERGALLAEMLCCRESPPTDFQKEVRRLIAEYEKCCEKCGKKLEWGNDKGEIFESPWSIEGYPVCRDCMTEHCRTTDCEKCEFTCTGADLQWRCAFTLR